MNANCDIFAASQTGTGKTFCFVLPILNNLLIKNKKEALSDSLNEQEATNEKTDPETNQEPKPTKSKQKPDTRALIIVPTRELALQISQEFRKFKKAFRYHTCCLIGGMSREKQIRNLEQGTEIIIATVGRLLDLIQNEDNVALKKLGFCKYLVIDEVDRLIELGQFKELKEILKFLDNDFSKKLIPKNDLNLTKLNKENDLQIDGDEEVLLDDMDVELDENDNQLEDVNENMPKDSTQVFEMNLPEDEFIKQIESQIEAEYIEINGEKIKINDEFTVEKIASLSQEDIQKIKLSQKSRKTYLFSATLTQISWTSRMLNNKNLLSSMKAMKNNSKFKHLSNVKEYPKIFDIMRKIRTNYKLEIVNCTKSEEEVFPPNMEILKVKCIAQEKMLHLYHFLDQENCQRNIVFCNSIRSSRQVLSILNYCGMEVVGLHSHMQQRQRIKKIEKFKNSKKNIVLITTDVASRGLHVEDVGLVIHFHTPRDYDTFVHRSGRTARMGREGKVILLEDSHDRKRFAKFQKDIVHKQLKNIGKEILLYVLISRIATKCFRLMPRYC
jgi:ATP-dependent RNA helicase DDX24/MAK5